MLGDRERAARRVVSIELAGEASVVSAVESVLRERLAGLDVDLSFTNAEAVDPAKVVTPSGVRDDDLARIWVDLKAEQRATLYVVDGTWERVLVRHFPRHDNPEIVREEIGHVVELSVVSLRAGERIGVGRDIARAELVPEAPPTPTPTPTPPSPPEADRPPAAPVVAPPRPKASTRFAGGLFYEAQAYGGGPELWSGPGALFEVRAKPAASRFSYGGLVSVQYRLPSDASGNRATVDFEGGAAHLLALGAMTISAPAQLALGLGGGVDVLHAEARGEGPSDVSFVGGSTRLVPTMRALVRYEHVISSLRLFGGVGLDVPVERARYLILGTGGPTVVFEAWAARPFLLVGIQAP